MDEALKYAIENGMIDLSYVQEQIAMKKREELLAKHPYTISKGKDGKWRTYLPDEKKGRIQRERNTKEEIEKIVIEYWKEQDEDPTIEEVFDEWNDRRFYELGQISRSTHLRNKQIFNRHYQEIRKRHIKSVKPEEIQDFLEKQIFKCQLSFHAFSNLRGITKGFLKRAKKRKLIFYDVTDTIQDLEVSKKSFHELIKEDYQEVFNEKELPIIMSYLTNNLDTINMCILLMFITGMRVGEVVALKHSDIHDGSINVRRTETKYPDGDEKKYGIKDFPKTKAGIRSIVIPQQYEWVLEKLKALNPSDEFIFYQKNKKDRMHTNSVRTRMRAVCKKLNIYPKSPHKARKTYSSILLDNHIDNKLITDQMGHTNISCDEIHYHRNRKDLDRKQDIISNIPDFNIV